MWKKFLAWLSSVFTSKPVLIETPTPQIPLIIPSAPIEPVGLQEALSWELPCNDGQVSQGAHPERKAWSEALYAELEKSYLTLMSAKDIRSLIPNIDFLDKAQRLTCLAELMSTVAEYESSWNPACIAKDVNGRSEPQYMATGFFQMNEGDQTIYHSGTSFNYTQLKDPFNNIKVGVGILVYVLKVRGKITFAKEEKSSVISYFYATLLTNGAVGPKVLASYYKRIAAFKFNQVTNAPPPLVTSSNAPWTKWFEDRLGWTEFDHDKELSKGWKYTNVPDYKTVIGTEHAWCAMSLNTALEENGYKGTRDASAISFKNYGTPCELKENCIVVVEHSSGNHHVAICKKGRALIGGNQNNSICIKELLDSDKIIATRWPVKA